MRRAAVILGVLLAVACNEPRPAADGYTFGEPTWVQTDLRVKIVLVRSEAEMRRLGPQVAADRELVAFARVSPDGTCTIYKLDSRVRYLPEWDGHELNHCIYGEWHQ